MAKFGINDIIDIRSKAPKTEEVSEYKEIWLNPYDVKPADSNFYSQEDIEELADFRTRNKRRLRIKLHLARSYQ